MKWVGEERSKKLFDSGDLNCNFKSIETLCKFAIEL